MHIFFIGKRKSPGQKKWLSIKAFLHDKDNFIKSVRELGTEDIVPLFGLLTSCLSLWSHPRWFLLGEKNISLENKVEISVEKRGFPLQEKWISFVASFALSFPVYCFAPPLTSQPCWDSWRSFTLNCFQRKSFCFLLMLEKLPGSGGRSLPQLPDRVPKNLSRIWKRGKIRNLKNNSSGI